jgi:Helicase associated domain
MQRENYRETQMRSTGSMPKRTKPRPTLSRDRIALLNALGFQWKIGIPAVGWEHRFRELLEYRRLHGDCNVPQAWTDNRQLGRYV